MGAVFFCLRASCFRVFGPCQAQVRQGASPGRFPDLGLLSSSASSWALGMTGRPRQPQDLSIKLRIRAERIQMASSNWRTPPRWQAFTTPFAEKPVDGGEDHNVWIYYLITAGGGGVKKVLREKGSKSSDLYPDHPGNVRRTRPSCTTRGSCRPDRSGRGGPSFGFGEELAV